MNRNNRERYDPDKRRRWDLRRRYGITPEAWEAMHAAQGGRCLICGGDGGDRSLAVDHNHITGAIRGLLCGDCNLALGLLKEDPETIAKAAIYVARHQGVTQ